MPSTLRWPVVICSAVAPSGSATRMCARRYWRLPVASRARAASISPSLTLMRWMKPWRRRWTVISSFSERLNSSNDRPSEARRWRSPSRVRPFCWAIMATAWLTSCSLTRMPCWRARATCRRVRTRRSSTWRSSTGRGGSWLSRPAYWAMTLRRARSSSLCRITSSSTIAAMRSTGCSCCWASWATPATGRDSMAEAARRIAERRRLMDSRDEVRIVVVRIGRGVAGRDQVQVVAVVAENSTAQGALRVLAGRAQALEHEFHLQRVVQLALAVAHVAAGDGAHREAAAVPLHAGDRLQQLVAGDGVVVAADQAPGRVDRVQEREVGLLQQPAAVAVAEVDHAVVRPQVAGADAGQVLAAELRVPLVGSAEVPAVVDHVVGVGHPGRLALRHRGLVPEHHPRVLEVADLAEAQRQLLAAVGLADQARTEGDGQLVGVGLAVGAGIAVVAEQLAPAEGERPGVEHRQVVLVAVRRVQVEQARLQGVQEALAVPAGLAGDVRAGVEAGDGRAAGGVFRAAEAVVGVQQLAFLQAVGGVAPGEGRVRVPCRTAQARGHERLQFQALAAADP